MDSSANVLVADDERGMLNTLVGILEDEGYQVYGCQEGSEAIKHLSNTGSYPPIDVVISDLKLADMSGLAILSHLKKTNAGSLFILITANATLETAIDAINEGAFAYHIKPLDMDALINSVRNAVRQQRLLAENKALLERVQQSELKYRTLVEQAGDGIFMVDPASGRFIESNPKMETLTGHRREDLLNMTLPVLYPESERLEAMEFIRQTAEHGLAAVDDLTFQHQNGDRIAVDLNSRLVEYQGEKVVLVIARDVTEKKATEEKLRETSRLVSIGQLAAGVAHEINNPLTVVMGYSDILLREELKPSVQNRVQGINTEAHRAARIVRNLLSFARKHETDKRYMDVTSILEKALELKVHDFRLNNIEVNAQWPPDLPRTMVDEHQLVEVVLNILINAEQAMTESHRGGELSIRASHEAGSIKVSIADNGPGIQPELLGKIFDPFFTSKEVGKGTGLGLSICYGIVRQHNGEIWAESAPGAGATFNIALPVLGPPAATEAGAPEIKHTSNQSRRALVVDDEANIRNFLATALSEDGCTVDVAEDGREAWQKLQKNTYDQIFLDLKMPGVNGQELYRLLEDHDKSLARKVVFITGDTISQDTRDFITAAGNPCLAKPFSIAQLRQQVLERVM